MNQSSANWAEILSSIGIDCVIRRHVAADGVQVAVGLDVAERSFTMEELLTHRAKVLSAMTFFALVFATPSLSENYQIFPSREALDTEISTNMAEARFGDLVISLAPGTRTAPGRIRSIEEAVVGNVAGFNENVVLFASGAGEPVRREVRGWWSNGTYVFLGTLTHERADGVVVLDFMLTDDVQRASSWYLSGSPE